MHQDQGRRVQRQRPLDHFARVDGHVIDGAAALFLVRDEGVLAVEVEDAKLLHIAVGHGRVAIVDQRVPGADDRPLQNPGAGQTLGGGLDQLELADHRVAHALDLAQPIWRGRDDAVEIAEGFQKAPAQWLHVGPRIGTEKHHFKQLVIRHRRGAALHEPLAQALAVIGDVGRLARRVRPRLAGGGREERQGRFVESGSVRHARYLRDCWLARG